MALTIESIIELLIEYGPFQLHMFRTMSKAMKPVRRRSTTQTASEVI
jgi:hypothetical protein